MPGVTLIADEEFIERADSIVKEQRAQLAGSGRGATVDDIRRAKRIAETKGQAAANEFLARAARANGARRVSRMRVLIALADLGYGALKNDERIMREALQALGKPDKPIRLGGGRGARQSS